MLSVYSTVPEQRITLLQFDVSGLSPADVDQAFVQLTQLDGSYDDEPLEISVYAVAAPWEEGTGGDPWSTAAGGVTWNSAGNGVLWNEPGGDLNRKRDIGNGPNGLITTQVLNGFDATRTTLELDVTSAVTAWLDGSLPNYGLALVVTQGQYTEYLFASSEAADTSIRPHLVILPTT